MFCTDMWVNDSNQVCPSNTTWKTTLGQTYLVCLLFYKPTDRRCRPCCSCWHICQCARSQRCWSLRWAWLSAGRSHSSTSLRGERGQPLALSATCTGFPVCKIDTGTNYNSQATSTDLYLCFCFVCFTWMVMLRSISAPLMVKRAESWPSGRSSQLWNGKLAYVSCISTKAWKESILKEIFASASS